MNSRTIRWFLGAGLLASGATREAEAQSPTLGTEIPQIFQGPPGSSASMLGPTPGIGGGTFASPAVGGGQILGGRPGTATPRVPASISTPGSGGNSLAPLSVPSIPALPPLTAVPSYGTLALPSVAEEGPPDGLTFDQALEVMLRENLDLRARRVEIPSAKADIITAGLRGNPIIYGDSQLIPYGGYSTRRPGGPLQYDLNISQPIDFSRKRLARIAVANSTLKAVEFQYQDAVRIQIGNLAIAYVGVVSARETLLYAEAGLAGLDRILDVTRRQQTVSDRTSADVSLLESQRWLAAAGVRDAHAGLLRTKRALASYMNLPPYQAEAIQIRAQLKLFEPPIPPGEELANRALSCRADVMAYREGVKVAKDSLDLQYKNRFADAYVLYQPYTFQNLAYLPNTHSATSWAVGLTVPLPVFNRNQGNIARAKLNIEQSELQWAAVQRLAIEQVRDADSEYRTTKELLEGLERDVVPAVRKAMSDTERLFTAGENSAPDVTAYLNVQKRYNDIVRQYRDTAVRHLRSMAALNTAVGARVLP